MAATTALPNLARLAQLSSPTIVPERSSLEIVTDANFDSAVLASPQPVLLELYAEYCGPCKACEPGLQRLDATFPELKVVKSRLNQNPAVEEWILTHGLKVSKLPTLLLVKGGAPLRALTGKAQILDEHTLHGFAFDAAFQGAVVPTQGALKHAHDGAEVTYAENLDAMGEREQTRELQLLVSRLRATPSTPPDELATLEAMLLGRQQRERHVQSFKDGFKRPDSVGPACAAPELSCPGGVCQRR